MNKIDYYKINDITEIHVKDKYIENGYSYFKEYKKRRFLRPSLIMFDIFKLVTYDDYLGDSCINTYYESRDEVLKHECWGTEKSFVIIDNLVFHRAKVSIRFSHRNSCDCIKLFDSIIEAEKWVDDLLENNNLNKEIVVIK